MTPFAYQFIDTDYGDLTANEVFPTLRAAYEWVIRERPVASRASGLEVYCWYAHTIGGAAMRRTTLSFDSVTFQHRREPTEPELEAIRASAAYPFVNDVNAAWRARNAVYLIESRTQACGVTWKTPEEVDWPALDAQLEEIPHDEP